MRQLLLSGLITFAVLAINASPSPVLAQRAGVLIEEVFVDLDTGELTIVGQNLVGPDELSVLLGGDPIAVTTSSASEITALLPDGIGPGDYRLSVVAGRGSANTDSYDLTIAAAAADIGSCPAGSSIREINDDGTVVCEADDDTIPTASCPLGQFVEEIQADGTVVCAAVDALSFFRTSSALTIPAGAGPITVAQDASCPSGATLISGGFDCPGVTGIVVNSSLPLSSTTWRVKVTAVAGGAECIVWAYCAD